MPNITNFEQARKALFAYVQHSPDGKNYKLETMQMFMKYLGNPQNKLKVVHVAGTSGKTSTSYYIAAMLHAAGFKTGLTVSPYVEEINERVQINGEPLAEEYFCEYLDEFLNLLKGFNRTPSYFELLVGFAYWVFAKMGVEYAVIEVGLGGMRDSTNVVDRQDKVCVITDIGFDHTNILGNTLAEIASQKAGIVLPGNDVYMFSQPAEVMNTVKDYCKHQKAKLHVLEQTNSYTFLKNLPLFQQRNWQLAYNVVGAILEAESKKPLSTQQKIATANIQIPGRMDVLKVDGKTVILDGSHNAQKIGALVRSIKNAYPRRKVATLLSLGHNKTAILDEVLAPLSDTSSKIVVTKFSFGQDEFRLPIDPQIIVDSLDGAGYKYGSIEPDPVRAFYKLLGGEDEIILVTGSFFLLNNIRPLVSHAQQHEEVEK